ncbi:hypothetical protein ABS735_16990 [Streptomyces sp. MMCC 100]|uniref:hypothetical protein n=1 Tax=Streptomyces sp. MMCC 100 TaxID=3163555 RepID=UPI0035965CE5
MQARRALWSSVGTLVMVAAGLTVTASPAYAAGYNGACGSGYNVIDSMSVSSGKGTVYLTYNGGYNCLVTVNNTGSTLWMGAQLEIAGGSWKLDEGWYKSYAGPVYVYAANSCVDWGGWASTAKNGETFIKWNDHCG